jgi:MYXO-CTERM domain-containing protein
VTQGTWPASPDYDNLLSPQRIQFAAESARYVKFEADAVAGGGTVAIVGELAVGSSEAAVGDAGAGAEGGADGGQDGAPSARSEGGTDATVDAARAQGGVDATSEAEVEDVAGPISPEAGIQREAGGVTGGGGSRGGGGTDGGSRATVRPMGSDASIDASGTPGLDSASEGGCACTVGPSGSAPWEPAATVAGAVFVACRGRRRRRIGRV